MTTRSLTSGLIWLSLIRLTLTSGWTRPSTNTVKGRNRWRTLIYPKISRWVAKCMCSLSIYLSLVGANVCV
ncbi:hypothetical protein BDV96DRAFT_586810 [Lophiotrema nucula]|uniref:Secreted protein n=1 Tax=Lophiotrema nucula TaxID=690887 RepID=A0A6A5YRR7_9PLEO|nr:hypothetical protein BDV96DRAFT_586810 [Lophiotrema nucula]